MKKIEIAKMTLFVMALAAIGASAAEISWDQNPMAALKAALSQPGTVAAPVARMSAAAGTSQASHPERMDAQVVGGNEINPGNIGAYGEDPRNGTLEFNLNNDEDRVGAEYKLCPASMDDENSPSDCVYVQFYFPALRYDAQTKNILLGTDVVAKKQGFFGGGGFKLVNGYHLGYDVDPKTIDRGFDRDHGLVAIRAWLEKR